MPDARSIATDILYKIDVNDAYSTISVNQELKNLSTENSNDRAFISTLVYGVLERKILLDYNLSLYLNQPLKKLHPKVIAVLRAGAYQIIFLDNIPASAAVNESVKYAKKNKCNYATGLINAVLRKISSNGIKYPETDDMEELLHVKYSFPSELVNYFISSYGAAITENIMKATFGRRPLFIRVNTNKINEQDLIISLENEGVSVKKTKLADCLEIYDTGDIVKLKSFNEGLFHVQDMSSQICCKVLDARENETIVDCCAAPGGKTFTITEYMKDSGIVYSCDMYEKRTELIRSGAARLGLRSVKTICDDARNLKCKIQSADRVLCDVPCSGFGVIGRKPEIKYKKFDDIKDLPELQYEILSACCNIVKKDGILIYSTCTLNRKENNDVCEKFLAEHPDFSLSEDEIYTHFCGENKFIEILPEKESGDGFFIAKFVRI